LNARLLETGENGGGSARQCGPTSSWRQFRVRCRIKSGAAPVDLDPGPRSDGTDVECLPAISSMPRNLGDAILRMMPAPGPGAAALFRVGPLQINDRTDLKPALRRHPAANRGAGPSCPGSCPKKDPRLRIRNGYSTASRGPCGTGCNVPPGSARDPFVRPFPGYFPGWLDVWAWCPLPGRPFNRGQEHFLPEKNTGVPLGGPPVAGPW